MELNEVYSKRNKEIFGDERKRMPREKDKERERISHVVDDGLLAKRSEQRRQENVSTNLESEMRRMNIRSIFLLPLDVELERKKIKKEVKMAKRAKNFYMGKEKTIIPDPVQGIELDIQRSINVQAMENKGNEITVGARGLEPNGEDKMRKKARPDTKKETSVPWPRESEQNPRFENNVQANSMVNETKQINSFTSQQPQTTARAYSTGHLYLQKVPRHQVSSKNMVQSMPARRDAVCDLISLVTFIYKGKHKSASCTSALVSGNCSFRILSLKSVSFKW
ncbi:hypothetical protein AC249_AIPGENE1802 [Exaiptasia diaphana]|nr:hypothetical protein AC249_AIPGENE1802 [Exaiptasia diaphana]